MKKYAYIVDGKVMLSETEKPTPMALPSIANHEIYTQVFYEWCNSLVECDNVFDWDSFDNKTPCIVHMKDGWYFMERLKPSVKIRDGQAVDADNNTITKIL